MRAVREGNRTKRRPRDSRLELIVTVSVMCEIEYATRYLDEHGRK